MSMAGRMSKFGRMSRFDTMSRFGRMSRFDTMSRFGTMSAPDIMSKGCCNRTRMVTVFTRSNVDSDMILTPCPHNIQRAYDIEVLILITIGFMRSLVCAQWYSEASVY
jgi:hypothetical protein